MSVHKERNSWVVRKRINGKQRKFSPKTSGFPNTQKGARAFEAKITVELVEGSFYAPTKMTLGEYAARWLKVHVREKTGIRTQENYRYVLDNHILPALGSVPLSKLRPAQLEDFYAELSRKDGKAGALSQNTKCAIHRVLNAILNHAVSMEVIGKSPMKSEIGPKKGKPRGSGYTLEESKRILALSKNTELHLPLTLAIHTGLRVGEICALRWNAVDLQAKTITVDVILSRKQFVEKAPKTEESRRTVDIGASLVKLLEEQERKSPYVVCQASGKPYGPDHLSKLWRGFIRETDLPYRTFHSLRHTHAGLLIAQGEHAKTISSRLGHSNIATTMDIYGHLLKGVGEQAAAKLDAAFGG